MRTRTPESELPKKDHYTVYLTECMLNNKEYIGYHGTNDLNDDYLGSGPSLNKDIKRFGKQFFVRKILFDFDNPGDMRKKEAELVNKEWIERDDTYNECLGGYGPTGFSKKTLERMRESHLGKVISEEQKDKLSEIGKKRYENPEEKRKTSELAIENWKKPGIKEKRSISTQEFWTIEEREKYSKKFSGSNNPYFGKVHSKEIREKISKKKKGQKLSEETKRKMSEAQRGIKQNPEHVIKRVEAMREAFRKRKLLRQTSTASSAADITTSTNV